jgi:ABC-type transport system involved in multi-copper enzyme maturation permease subunit
MTLVLALMRKDFQLHWRNILGMTAGLAALVWVLLWLLPPPERQGVLPVVLVPMLVNFQVGFATWLIDRERSRETFALLRAMPVSDAAIVTSKFATHAVLNLYSFGLMLAVYPRALTLLTPVTLVTVLVLCLTWGCSVIALRLVLPDKPGTIAPLTVLFVLALVGARLSQRHDLAAAFDRLASHWWFQYALWGGALLTSGGLWLAAVRWFESRDTRDLIAS